MKLTNKEKQTIIGLLYVQQGCKKFLVGFGKITKKQKSELDYYTKLINKVKQLDER